MSSYASPRRRQPDRSTALPPRAVFALLVVGFPGCRSSEGRLPAAEVIDSAGVRIVVNRAPRWERGDGWRVDAEPRVTIGVVEGAEEYLLDGVVDASRLSDGRIAVLNAGSADLRLYSTEGRFLWKAGREGQGPGEFRYPHQLLIGVGDTLAVWEPPARRVQWLTPDGVFVRARTLDQNAFASTPPWFVELTELLPDGDLLVRYTRFGLSSPLDRLTRMPSLAVRWSSDLSSRDTLASFGHTEQMQVDVGGRPMPFVPPYVESPSTTFAGVPTRVCIGDPDAPEVACFGPDGAEQRIQWEAEPVPISAADVAAHRGTLRGLLGDERIERLFAAAEIPEFRAAYGSILLDRGGNLWVPEPFVRGVPAAPYSAQVFDPDGEWLGEVTLPPVQLLEIGDEWVLGVHRDDVGVEQLQLFALHR